MTAISLPNEVKCVSKNAERNILKDYTVRPKVLNTDNIISEALIEGLVKLRGDNNMAWYSLVLLS